MGIRIRMAWALPDQFPDPLVSGMDPDPYLETGSFPYLIKMLSGLKQMLAKQILTQMFSKKINFED